MVFEKKSYLKGVETLTLSSGNRLPYLCTTVSHIILANVPRAQKVEGPSAAAATSALYSAGPVVSDLLY